MTILRLFNRILHLLFAFVHKHHDKAPSFQISLSKRYCFIIIRIVAKTNIWLECIEKFDIKFLLKKRLCLMHSISSIFQVVQQTIEKLSDQEQIGFPLIIKLFIALINNRHLVDQQCTQTHLLQVISSELDCFCYFRSYSQSSESLSDYFRPVFELQISLWCNLKLKINISLVLFYTDIFKQRIKCCR